MSYLWRGLGARARVWPIEAGSDPWLPAAGNQVWQSHSYKETDSASDRARLEEGPGPQLKLKPQPTPLYDTLSRGPSCDMTGLSTYYEVINVYCLEMLSLWNRKLIHSHREQTPTLLSRSVLSWAHIWLVMSPSGGPTGPSEAATLKLSLSLSLLKIFCHSLP